jgi:hypothetical protein
MEGFYEQGDENLVLAECWEILERLNYSLRRMKLY